MSQDIKIRKMAGEAFAPFGDLMDCAGQADREIHLGGGDWFADRAHMDFDEAGRAGVSLVKARQPDVFARIMSPTWTFYWIHPTLHVYAAIGTAPLSTSVNIPNNQSLRGSRLAWHAVQLSQPLVNSNPSWSLVF